MQGHSIRDGFDPELRKLKGPRCAVIPAGSIEQHGPHLPVSTDSDIAGHIAAMVAQKNKYLLLPTITLGVSYEHAPLFHLSIRPSTLRNALRDLCLSLYENKITTAFIINGHHGNIKALSGIDKKVAELTKGRMHVSAFSYWHFMQREFDHAGFVETSLMLAISKNVRMGLAKRGLVTQGLSRQELRRLSVIANRSFPKATKTGVWGDPTGATKRAGREILAQIVENLAKKCQTCLTEYSS